MEDLYQRRRNRAMNYEKDRKIKEIVKDTSNSLCIDCNESSPEFISLNNGIFICANCAKIHQKFPPRVSKLLKNNLTQLSLKEIQFLYYGGNKKLIEYINYE